MYYEQQQEIFTLLYPANISNLSALVSLPVSVPGSVFLCLCLFVSVSIFRCLCVFFCLSLLLFLPVSLCLSWRIVLFIVPDFLRNTEPNPLWPSWNGWVWVFRCLCCWWLSAGYGWFSYFWKGRCTVLDFVVLSVWRQLGWKWSEGILRLTDWHTTCGGQYVSTCNNHNDNEIFVKRKPLI